MLHRYPGLTVPGHSSEKRGLCSTKYSSTTLQNLLCFMYKKSFVKTQNCMKWKSEKNLYQAYLIHKLCLPIIFEIMANFEAFWWNISVNANLIFLKSDLVMMKNVIGFYYEIFFKVKHRWEGPQSMMKKISTYIVHIFGILPNATASQWH